MQYDAIQDNRRHALMTEEMGKSVPPLGANAENTNVGDLKPLVRLFTPYSRWTWYILEFDHESQRCFGLAEGFDQELGYFDLGELSQITVFDNLPAVERDLHWEPKTVNELREEWKKERESVNDNVRDCPPGHLSYLPTGQGQTGKPSNLYP